MTRERSHDFCQTRLLTRRVVFSICRSVRTPEDVVNSTVYIMRKLVMRDLRHAI